MRDEPEQPSLIPNGDEGFWENCCKFQARLLLIERKGIVIPTWEEWVGINLLERDDQLRGEG
jgi:hypothetical protein